MGTERLTSSKVSSSLQNKGEDKDTMLFNQLFQRYQQLLLKWGYFALYRDSHRGHQQRCKTNIVLKQLDIKQNIAKLMELF